MGYILMLQGFSELAQKYIDNAKKYNELTATVKQNTELTPEQLVENLKQVAFSGNQILEESKALMSALGLIGAYGRPAPEFDLDDAYALYDFARKCNKSGDLPWSDEEDFDGVDDCFLALEVLDIVIRAADKHDDLLLKIRSSDWFSHHCINSATFLVGREKEFCAEILAIPYDSLPCKTFSDAKARLVYALIVFNYSPLGIINDTEESYDNLFESFERAEAFREKYAPPLGEDVDLRRFGSDSKAVALDFGGDEVWDKQWESPELRAWAGTLMEGAASCQARELAKRWHNYEANVDMIRSYAGHFGEHLCQRGRTVEYAQRLHDVYAGYLGEDYSLEDVLSDCKQTAMLVGRAITGLTIAKHQGGQISEYLRLLQDISRGIISGSDSANWYEQINFVESLIGACATLCKHLGELTDGEKRESVGLALDAVLYIQRQDKELRKGICSYRKELSIIAGCCSGPLSRRTYIEFLFVLASQDHLPTYAHCLVVARLNEVITRHALDLAPELLVGIMGTEDADGVRWIADDSDLRRAFIEEMELAGLGHDLGKMFQIHAVSQCARPLTDTEYTGVIRRHVELGSDILDIEGFELLRACAAYHHAFAEGNGRRGYPDNAGVKSSPFKAAINITHVSDVLSAISDNLGRYYAKPRTVDEAFEQILKDSECVDGNVELDPGIVGLILDNGQVKDDVREVLTAYNEEAYWTAYKALGVWGG